MSRVRGQASHAAVLLSNGKVLIAGIGISAALYDLAGPVLSPIQARTLSLVPGIHTSRPFDSDFGMKAITIPTGRR